MTLKVRPGRGVSALSRSLHIRFLAFFCVTAVILFAGAGTARACGDSCLTCIIPRYQLLNQYIDQENEKTRRWITEEFQYHRRDFFVGYFFHWHILNAMENMSEELTTNAMFQVKMIGKFFDAKHQLETQRLLQQMTARAHKDYHPSFDMCVLGTATKFMTTLAEAARKSPTQMEAQQRQRQLHSSPGDTSPATDFRQRMATFKSRFCDINDNDKGLGPQSIGGRALPGLCSSSADPYTINKDVDYTRTISFPLTIQANEAADVDALSKNLFGHRVFNSISGDYLGHIANQDLILDFHSLIAKRAVAAHSFNSIAAMKTHGRMLDPAEEVPDERFLHVLLKTLGVTNPDEYDRYLGYRDRKQNTNLPQYLPSYYAIMEMLTKKIYQDPQFYVNLYDKPVNVDRKGVAIRGISLMQDMDMFKSQLRNEAALSVLLESHIMELHDHAQDGLGRLRPEGPVE